MTEQELLPPKVERAARHETAPPRETVPAREPSSRGGGAFGVAPRHLWAAVRITSSATVLTLLLSVGSNKVLAVVGGTAAVGMMGLFRSLGTFVTRALLMGFDAVILQRISTAKTDEEKHSFAGAAVLLFALQALAVCLVGIFAAPLLSAWLFGAAHAGEHVTEARIVLAMGYVNVLFLVCNGMLSGEVKLKQVTRLSLLAAAVSLAVMYPLVKMGNVGLAINIGSGSLVALAGGLFLVHRYFRTGVRTTPLAVRWQVLKEMLSRSGFIMIYPIAMMGSAVTVQSMLRGHYGADELGLYNSGVLVIEALLAVAMSPLRTYCLPSLGKCDNDAQKAAFLSRSAALFVLIATAQAALLIAGSHFLLAALFRKDFTRGSEVVAIFGLSLLGQSINYTYNALLLHRADYRLNFVMDSGWAILLVTAVYLCCRSNQPLGVVAWCYTGSYTVSAVSYLLVTARLFGRSYIGRRNVLMVCGSAVWLGLGFLLSHAGIAVLNGLFLLVTFGVCALAARRLLRDDGGQALPSTALAG